MVVRRSSVAAARQINLNQKKLKREAEHQATLDLWCNEHDRDGNGEFDRDELRSLLNALHPTQPVEDSMLDELLEKATGVYTSSLTLRGDKRNRMLKVPSWWCHRPPRAEATLLYLHLFYIYNPQERQSHQKSAVKDGPAIRQL